jgi:hypothetical protein
MKSFLLAFLSLFFFYQNQSAPVSKNIQNVIELLTPGNCPCLKKDSYVIACYDGGTRCLKNISYLVNQPSRDVLIPFGEAFLCPHCDKAGCFLLKEVSETRGTILDVHDSTEDLRLTVCENRDLELLIVNRELSIEEKSFLPSMEFKECSSKPGAWYKK